MSVARPSLWRKRLSFGVVVFLLAFVLWGYVVGPMGNTLRESLRDGPGGRFGDWASFFGIQQNEQIVAMGGSLLVSLLSVITTGLIGVSLAVLFHRWDFPLKKLCSVMVFAPFAIPPLIGSYAFSWLYGIGGVIPSVLERMFHLTPHSVYVSGLSGVFLVHTLTMYPFFYLVAAAALAQTDDSLEEAAQSLGASRWRTWTRVLLPLLTPAMVSGALLTFLSSMASYTAPYVFHFQHVMTVQITDAETGGSFRDLRLVSVISVMLAFISVLFLIAIRLYERRQVYRTPSKGGARMRRRVSGPVARALAAVIALGAILFLILPILMIFVLAFSVNGSWRTGPLPSRYTLRNFAALFHAAGTLAAIQNSLEMSAIAVAGVILLGVTCAYVLKRVPFRGSAAMDVAVMLPWALPGTVVGVNLITAFGRPSLFSLGTLLLTGGYAIVPLAYFVRFTPFVFRSTAASLEQLDPALEDAARILGGTWWHAFTRVVLPLLSRGIAGGALLAFVAGVGEYVATTLLKSPFYPTISVKIDETLHSSAMTDGIGGAAALGSLQVLIVVLVVAAALRMQRGNPTVGSS